MMHRGTLAEFNIWHNLVMAAENIPPDGKIGFVNGIPAPDNQRTISYSNPIQNLSGGDDYVWFFGNYPDSGKTNLSMEDIEALGWFVES